jgi:O-antigen/teichoic acid export membrane protein
MVPAGVFLASAYNALQYWASRKKRFGLITQTRMTRAVGGVGSQAALGAITQSPFGLIFGQMLYSGLGSIGLMYNLWSQDRAKLSAVSWRRILRQARQYRKFPIWSVPEALFNTAGNQLPILMLAAFIVGPEVGFLFLAMRVMGLPMALLGASVSQVFLAEAPEKLRNGELSEFTRQTMKRMLGFGAPPLVASAVLAPFFFPLFFGPEWGRAGWLVAWMTPWFILQFVASPVSMVLHVLGRQQVALVLQGTGFVIRLGLVTAALTFASPHAAEVFAVSGALFYAVYLATILCVISSKGQTSKT